MTFYFPKKRRPWAILSAVLKSLIYVLKHWPLWLLLAALISPISPHVLTTYRVSEYGMHRIYQSCTYLGLRGFIRKSDGDCPAIALIDRRNYQ